MSLSETEKVSESSSVNISSILADFFLKKLDMPSYSDDSDHKRKAKKKKSKHKKSKHKKSKRRHRSTSSSSSQRSDSIQKNIVDDVSSSEEMSIKRLKKIKNMKLKSTVLPCASASEPESIMKDNNDSSQKSVEEKPVFYGPSLELLFTGVDSNISNSKFETASEVTFPGGNVNTKSKCSGSAVENLENNGEPKVCENENEKMVPSSNALPDSLPKSSCNSAFPSKRDEDGSVTNTENALCSNIKSIVTEENILNGIDTVNNDILNKEECGKIHSEIDNEKVKQTNKNEKSNCFRSRSRSKSQSKFLKSSSSKQDNKQKPTESRTKSSSSDSDHSSQRKRKHSRSHSPRKHSYKRRSLSRSSDSKHRNKLSKSRSKSSSRDSQYSPKKKKYSDSCEKYPRRKRSYSKGRSRSHSRSRYSKSKRFSRSRSRHRRHSKSRRSRSRSHSRVHHKESLNPRRRSRSRQKEYVSKLKNKDKSSKKITSHSRSRSKSKSRKSRSRSKNRRSRSKSKTKRSRSRSRSEGSGSKNKSRRSRSTSKSRRSNSKSKSRRSRSKSKSRRSRSKSKTRRSRSGSKSRTASKSNAVSHSKSKSKSPERKSKKIDQAKILETARKNVLKMMKSGTMPEGFPVENIKKEQIISIQAGGKSVQELTDFCQRLSQKENDPNASNEDDDDEKPDDETGFIHHPFKVKEPGIIKMNIKGAVPLPIKTPAEKVAETARLSSQFPVSSGNQHKQKELEWIPVVPEKPKTESKPVEVKEPEHVKDTSTVDSVVSIAPILPPPPPPQMTVSYPPPPPENPVIDVIPLPPPQPPLIPPPMPPQILSSPLSVPMQPPSPLVPCLIQPEVQPPMEPNYQQMISPCLPQVVPQVSSACTSVFKPPKKIDIASIVAKRFQALTKLQQDPNNPEALGILQEAQENIQEWVQSQQVPGLFTGSTDAKVLSVAELCGPKYYKFRKDFLSHAPPVTEGKGMSLLKKMGWNPGEGLGKNKEGSLEPLLLDIKTDKKGLVSEGENSKKGASSLTKELQGKHPVSALMELCSKRKWKPPLYTCILDKGPPHRKQFCFKVEVNGVDYQPLNPCSNKKVAKADAAVICLQALNVFPKPS